MIESQIVINNRLGMHARAAARFVKLASAYASSIELIKDGFSTNGKSIMGIMMLAASQGTELTLRVEGVDELEAYMALRKLVEDRFGEDE